MIRVGIVIIVILVGYSKMSPILSSTKKIKANHTTKPEPPSKTCSGNSSRYGKKPISFHKIALKRLIARGISVETMNTTQAIVNFIYES